VTWTKLGDDYADELAKVGVSDAAYRTLNEMLIWANRRENGATLTDRDVLRCTESPNVAEALAELVCLGLIDRIDGGYRVVFHIEHQVEPEVIKARKSSAARRARDHRRRKAGLSVRPDDHVTRDVTDDVRDDVTRDVRADSTRDPGLVGSGQVGKTKPQQRDQQQANGHGTIHALHPTTRNPDGATP
jgi:hypothetical protein